MLYDADKLNSIDIIYVADKLGLCVHKNKTNCFLHNDKTPSLSFNIRTNMWKCFGCNSGGNVIELVKRKNNVDFKDACLWLEHHCTGAEISHATRQIKTQQKNAIKSLKNTKRYTESDYELYDEIINHLSLSDKAVRYLCGERALSYDVLAQHHVVSLENPSELYNWLSSKFNSERLIKAGVVQNKEYGIQLFGKSRGIIFPYYNMDKKIVNLQFRSYETQKKAKYLFLSGIPTCMYNEDVLNTLKPNDVVYLCEGAIDALSIMTMNGVAVGIPGAAALKDEWIELLKRFYIKIVLDNDNTGKENAEKYKEILTEKKINASICRVAPYKDVNEKLTKEKSVRHDKQT